MKNCIFEELLILSTTERTAKRIKFHKEKNLILGANNTGKSSLIKTIYQTLGADPAVQNPRWKKLKPLSLLKFSIGNRKFQILRNGKFYAIFDNKNKLLSRHDRIVSQLGPAIAELFDFKIKLPDRHGNLITPPPAYLFLPYYIDQDKGWSSSWSSFSGLGIFKDNKKPFINYHTGLRTNEYYEAKSVKDELTRKIDELQNERDYSKQIIKKINEELTQVDFDIDIDDFKSEVNELLVECQNLKRIEEKYKAKLVDYFNTRTNLQEQIEITVKALKETAKDYKYATSILDEEHVECPTCGANYENSFVERFNLAQDQDRCEELLIELREDLGEIDSKIKRQNENLNSNSIEIKKIEEILSKKKGQIKLRDLIENEGKRELKKVFDHSIKGLLGSITESAYKLDKVNETLKALENKKRKQKILEEYRLNMRRYLNELSVGTLTEDDYKDITKKLSETGSAMPRTLTAYFFSVIQLVRKYSSSVFCPLVIDSPNQQAQDFENIDKILNFIKKNQPSNSQLILGLENTFNVDFDCNIIKLESKYQLLNKSDYDEVISVMQPLIDNSLTSDTSKLL